MIIVISDMNKDNKRDGGEGLKYMTMCHVSETEVNVRIMESDGMTQNVNVPYKLTYEVNCENGYVTDVFGRIRNCSELNDHAEFSGQYTMYVEVVLEGGNLTIESDITGQKKTYEIGCMAVQYIKMVLPDDCTWTYDCVFDHDVIVYNKTYEELKDYTCTEYRKRECSC